MIVRSDIAQSLKYGGRAAFLEGLKHYPVKRQLIAEPATSSGNEEVYLGLGANPLPLEALDQVQPRGVTERSITIVNKDWETTFEVSHNAINDDRVGHLEDKMRSAGEAFQRHMDKLCWQALNGGDGTTYGSCYDGLEFFDTLHVDAGADYTTAQSNLGTTTLSLDGFNTIWQAAVTLRDDRGEFVEAPLDLLLVNQANMVVAAQICNNELAYDTANREVNPFTGMFRFYWTPHFDAAAWTISSTLRGHRPIIFQLREAPDMEEPWDDRSVAFEGGARYFKFSARYWLGYANYRNAYMGKT